MDPPPDMEPDRPILDYAGPRKRGAGRRGFWQSEWVRFGLWMLGFLVAGILLVTVIDALSRR